MIQLRSEKKLSQQSNLTERFKIQRGPTQGALEQSVHKQASYPLGFGASDLRTPWKVPERSLEIPKGPQRVPLGIPEGPWGSLEGPWGVPGASLGRHWITKCVVFQGILGGPLYKPCSVSSVQLFKTSLGLEREQYYRQPVLHQDLPFPYDS